MKARIFPPDKESKPRSRERALAVLDRGAGRGLTPYGGKRRAFIYGFSQLRKHSFRNRNPPAMRVEAKCYTKKHLSDTLKLFRLSANLQGKVFLWEPGLRV